MRKWKRVLSILLMGAMLAGNVFVAAPETVRAEETAANRKGFIECKLADSDGRATYLGSWGGNVGDVCNITWTGPEANQEWEFREINTGVYTLVKVDSQKVLTALEDFTVGQRDLIENAASQQWIFVEDGEGYYRIKNVGTGLYLTTKRMAPQNDGMGQEKEIILTESAESDAQLWKPALSGHIVSGVSWNGNKLYAAVDTGIPGVGQRIITWTGPKDNQKMIFRKIDETEYYQILNFDSNGKLALQAKDDGEIVLENSDETNQYQQWSFEEVDNTDTYRIKNAGNEQYFTTPRKETSADRYSVVRTEELEMGSASQLWTLEGALVVHPEVKVTGITITSAMEVTVGQTLALTATVEPADATNPEVVWSIQDGMDVLTLEGNTLTAVNPGTATVVATAADGSGVTAFAEITVNPVMATGIEISGAPATMTIGTSEKLTAVVTPESTTNKAVTWQSSNEDVVVVENGLVTAKSVGDAIITATTADGSDKSAQVTITVKEQEYTVSVTNGQLISDKTSFKAGEQAAVKADDPADGKKFAYWKDTNNNQILCYRPDYSFYVMYDMALEACYVDDDAEVEKGPTITCTSLYDAAAGKMKFTANRSLPGGYTIIRHGVLITQDESVAYSDNFVYGTAGVKRSTAKENTLLGTYVAILKCNLGDVWYGRGYVEYSYTDAAGNEQTDTMYSNTVVCVAK